MIKKRPYKSGETLPLSEPCNREVHRKNEIHALHEFTARPVNFMTSRDLQTYQPKPMFTAQNIQFQVPLYVRCKDFLEVTEITTNIF
jgi:hypothetical protein